MSMHVKSPSWDHCASCLYPWPCREALVEQLAAAESARAALEAENGRLRQGIDGLRIKHLQVEDSYYSCPSGGIDFSGAEAECECGAEAHNAKIDALLSAQLAAAPGDGVREAADKMAEHFPQVADMSGPRSDGSGWVSWKCCGCDAPEIVTGGAEALAHEADCVYRQYRDAVGRGEGA